MPTVVEQDTIPESIRALDALRSNYVDVFTAMTREATDASPEQWARVAIEGASPVGSFIAWRALLGLRLESRPSPNYIGGWKIVDRGNSWIRLEASSWFMTANMIFHVEEGRVNFATLIRYDRSIAAFVWTPVSAIHRRVAPGFLRHAVRRIHRVR